MRRIYFTVNIDVNDRCFKNLENIEKLNLGDILKQRKISLMPDELEKIRGEIITETIIACKGDLLIGFAIKEKRHLKNILEILKEKQLLISRIYYDNGERREAEINEYKKKYALHSNWLDYSPEFIEHQFQIFEEKVLEIKEEAIHNNIETMAI